jgi:hypothetical protein
MLFRHNYRYHAFRTLCVILCFPYFSFCANLADSNALELQLRNDASVFLNLLESKEKQDVVKYISRNNQGEITAIFVPEALADDRYIRDLKYIRTLQRLVIRSPVDPTRLKAEAFKALRGLTALRDIELLCFTRITPDLLRIMSDLKQVKRLKVTFPLLTNDSIAALLEVRQLESLELVHPIGFDDQKMEMLSKLKYLRSLTLMNSDVTVASINIIGQFPSLTNAYIAGTALNTNWIRMERGRSRQMGN